MAFVGNVFPGPRAELLALLRRRYPRSFIGNAYFDEMARTYSAARAAFNRSIKNDVNMRVFEAVACGSMLMTNDLADNGQDELFRDGVHLATYRGPEEMLDKLAFYLGREEVRERIAATGRAEAIEKHTYRHRMERLLRSAEEALGRLSIGGLSVEGDSASARRASDGNGNAARAARLSTLRLRFVLVWMTITIRSTSATHGRRSWSWCRGRRGGSSTSAAARGGWARRSRPDSRPRSSASSSMRPPRRPRSCNSTRSWSVTSNGSRRTSRRGRSTRSSAPMSSSTCGNPSGVLRMARSWLAPDGRLIASVPNVRYHGVVRSLLDGNWTYEPAGLLDRTHLRFFTRREVEKLFCRAGFAVEELRWVGSPGDDPSQRRPGEVHAGRLQIVGLTDAEADEFFAYQYLAVARPDPMPDYGVTSIVIVTHNQLEYTRKCLDSVRHLTDEPYELIVVDNGSTDGTVEYLRALGGLRLIANEANRGFPAAANQGIAAAAGDQVLLLNNDVVVTTGWLGRLLRALYSDPAIGLVGPCSNCVSGPQQVETRYEGLADLDGFAWDWGKANAGVLVEVNRLVGFCLLIRRAVIEAIGLLDEQFGVGCFEDDDYTLRANRAGYRAVIAADAFVHHFGGRTFAASGVDFGALLDENHRRFRGEVGSRGRAFPSPGLRPPAPRQRGEGIRDRDGTRRWPAAGPRETAAVALHDRPRLGPDAPGLFGEHPAVGRRDGHRRYGFGQRDAADRRSVRRPAVPLPLVRRLLRRAERVAPACARRVAVLDGLR